MFSSIEIIESVKSDKQIQKDKNIKEWNRLNNIWLDIKNKNKVENPSLYSTDSENSADNNCSNNILKKSNSFSSYDDEITNNIDFINKSYDSSNNNIYDEYNIESYTPCSYLTQDSIKLKYTIENAASLELDYSLNYNMKMLTHIANYYEILKNKNKNKNKNGGSGGGSGSGSGSSGSSGSGGSGGSGVGATNLRTRSNTIKMCKAELIKSIVEFETNEVNHYVVYQCKRMLEYIEILKTDKYFASFVLFP
jgi:hypothetical protein